MATNVVVVLLVGTSCCYQNFNFLKLFISKQIVINLRIQIGDNILHNRTVSDFQVKS